MLDRLRAALADRYRLERELGAGGMATVYLAHDLRHDRQVALKVLRPELSAVIGAERFLVEIKTTANLQHPHILPLFDSGEVDGVVFYVMPLVEGESLRERLERERQLPLDVALRIAKEVASALDYAHRHGVIHRDIKPENILLHDGRAVVADFGIALAVSNTPGGTRMTETGMSLGTPHYMSPEQALGERAMDARTDVYALGCVLHEMLAGEPPFTGPTAQAVLARVMGTEPEPVTAIRKAVPEPVSDAILTALAKLPADRFATAADFAQALELGTTSGGYSRGAGRTGARAAPRSAMQQASRFGWPAVAVLALGFALWRGAAPSAVELVPSRLSIPAPTFGGSGTFLQRNLAISPDGRTVVYVDRGSGETKLAVRHMDREEATLMERVPINFSSPEFSLDGSEFFAANFTTGQMFRFPVAGGSGTPLPSELAWSVSIAFAEDGSLWLTPQSDRSRGLARLAPDGTVSYPLGPESSSLALQQILPGDRYALVVRSPIGTSFGPALALDLKTGETTPVLDVDVVEMRYAEGVLVYALPGRTLEAVRFDLGRRRPVGTPLELSANLSLSSGGSANFSMSRTGTVAFVPDAGGALVLMDRNGAARTATAEPRNYHIPRFSPDGRHLLVDFATPEGRDVWRLTLANGMLNRVTFDRDGHDATWHPDGRQFAYISARRAGGALSIYQAAVDRTTVDSLISDPAIAYTGVWLPDRSAIVTAGNSVNENTGADIAIVRNGGRGPVEALVASRFVESYPAVSPDGRWLAYTSDQTGTQELYLRSLAGGGDEIRVSLEGGSEPAWGPGGRELFYRAPERNREMLVAAAIRYSPELAVTERRALFDVSNVLSSSPHTNYDVSPDGRTFAMVQANPSTRIVIIQHVQRLLEERDAGARR